MAERQREPIIVNKETEQASRVFYYGSPGSFTEAAAIKHVQREDLRDVVLIPSEEKVSEIKAQVLAGHGVGVLPIENTNVGAVEMTLLELDAVGSGADLFIRGEIDMPIAHMLASCGSLEEVSSVVSHGAAVSQCSGNLEKLFDQSERRITYKTKDENGLDIPTSEAARMAKDDQRLAAICSEDAALKYGLIIHRRNFQDNPYNATRFIVIGNKPVEYDPGCSYKTSMIIYLKDQPGSLYDLLDEFASGDINLTQIKSYRSFDNHRKTPDHGFFITIDGHSGSPDIRRALGRIQRNVSEFRNLGSYPKTDEVGLSRDMSEVDWEGLLNRELQRQNGSKNGGDIHLIFILNNREGALRDTIRPFKDDNTNLTKVDSWGTGIGLGVYGFDLDFANPGDETKVESLMGRMELSCLKVVRRVNGN